MKLDEGAQVPLGVYEAARSWLQRKLQEYAREINRALPLAGGTVTGNLTVNGNTTLGDAAGDALTISGNAGVQSAPGTWATAARAFEFAYPTFGMDSNGAAFISFNAREETAGTWKYKSTDEAALITLTTGGGVTIATAASGTAGNTITFTTRTTIANGGLLTQDAGAGPEVARLDSTGETYLGWYRSAARKAYLQAHSTAGFLVVQEENLPVRLYTNNTIRTIVDASGNLIQNVNGTAPTLGTNGQMTFELTSNTELKIKVRGSDGTTRSVSLTLA